MQLPIPETSILGDRGNSGDPGLFLFKGGPVIGLDLPQLLSFQYVTTSSLLFINVKCAGSKPGHPSSPLTHYASISSVSPSQLFYIPIPLLFGIPFPSLCTWWITHPSRLRVSMHSLFSSVPSHRLPNYYISSLGAYHLTWFSLYALLHCLIDWTLPSRTKKGKRKGRGGARAQGSRGGRIS